ncbi:MAG TPA: helix-turn-helix domain-containing protein [Acidimicrobiales bacterium]|nr:helix-turn-helix domain-containing protein [Acidimicrobiales bacterium]
MPAPAVASRMAGAARRAHLLTVARRCFAAGGYHATTLSSIAREAGVSEPLLFKHFGSKEELFRLSIAEPMLDLLRTRTAQHPADEPVEDQQLALRAFLVTWAELVRDERSLALALLADLQQFPDVGAELGVMVRDHVDAVAAHIAATTDRREYRRFDPVVATWSGLAAATVAGLTAADPEAFVDEYLRILLHGVLAP